MARSRPAGRRRSAAMSSSCGDCGLIRFAYNSCRNRHCPKCQGLARAEWLAARQAELLPVPYFHVVFTLPAPVGRDRVPEQARGLRHPVPRRGRDAAHHRRRSQPSRRRDRRRSPCCTPGDRPCSTIRTCTASFPAAASRPTATRWIACRPGFFLPVRVLSRLFRRLFLGTAAQRRSTAGELALLRRARSPGRARRLRRAPRRRCAASTGWSTPSRPSAGPSRCWPISAATPTASPSPTAGWLGSTDGQVNFRWKDYRHHGKTKVDDARRRRVHPPLPAAHPAGRLPPHPPLRLPRQRPPRREAGALPQACSHAPAAPSRRRRPTQAPTPLPARSAARAAAAP